MSVPGDWRCYETDTLHGLASSASARRPPLCGRSTFRQRRRFCECFRVWNVDYRTNTGLLAVLDCDAAGAPSPRMLCTVCYCGKKGKGSPYSITERRVPELIPVLGSQPAGDVSHKPGGGLPLLFTPPLHVPISPCGGCGPRRRSGNCTARRSMLTVRLHKTSSKCQSDEDRSVAASVRVLCCRHLPLSVRLAVTPCLSACLSGTVLLTSEVMRCSARMPVTK